MSRKRICYNNCNAYANQYIFLVSIFTSIISEEIEDDEDLVILGSFLVALGEEISLASEIRISCKEKFKDQSGIQGQIQDVFDRSYKPGRKKVKRKVSKKK